MVRFPLFFRLRRYFFLNVFNLFFAKYTRFWSAKRFILRLACIKVGKNTCVVGPLKCGHCTSITMGDNCWIGMNLQVFGNGELVIGSSCDLAPEVSVITGSHKIGGANRRAGKGISFKVTIGNSVWVGAKSTFMGNIHVGNSTIVGACSLVNKNVEPNTCVGGVPAKVLKQL